MSHFSDPATYTEASTTDHPVDHIEPMDGENFLGDCLKDAVTRWRGDMPRTMQEMRAIFFMLIDEVMASADGREDESENGGSDAVALLLDTFTSSNVDGRLLAWCYKLAINRCDYSEVHIARMLGVSRANVSKIKLQIQDRWKLTPRVGRSEEAREKFKQICLSRTKPKRLTWSGGANLRNGILSAV